MSLEQYRSFGNGNFSISDDHPTLRQWKLSGPVGVGQSNNPTDVLIVQKLLNRSRGSDPTIDSLPETGVFDAETEHRLGQFQRDHAHLRNPDRVVGLPGPTERALGQVSQTTAGGLPSSDSPAVAPGGDAERILLLSAASPKSPVKKAFFNKILVPAVRARTNWGTPISVLVAQGALESTWGTNAPGNNYFGIKGTSPSGKSQSFATHEESSGHLQPKIDKFRAYANIEESVDDYGRFLRTNHRYAPAFAYSGDPAKFVHALCVAGYATLGAYEERIMSVIRFNGLADFDKFHPTATAIYMDAVTIGSDMA